MQDSRWSLAADCAAAGRLLPTFFAGPLKSWRTRFAGSAPPSTSNNDSALALGGLGDLARGLIRGRRARLGGCSALRHTGVTLSA